MAKFQFTVPGTLRKAHEHHLKQMLGLPKKLPKELSVPPITLQGIQVWVDPSHPARNGHKSSKHRIMCECPLCHQTLSAGRLFQHICKVKS